MIAATRTCEGQVIGKFPLRQCLGETESSTVFLTERDGGQKAVIKFVPAHGAKATEQLAHWKRIAQLSHPHLLRIFESGRCQLGGRDQVYAVMEFAEENLAEILPQRSLTPAETREMLVPLVDCLTYLHSNGFVHGRLRPGNIMAANNQLKLASDAIQQAGEASATANKRSPYNPPEVGTTTLSASADAWALGITLVEVLTQRVPDWETPAGEPVVPSTISQPFRDIVRNCLRRDPNARWTLPQINARLTQAPAVTPPPQTSAPEARKPSRQTTLLIAILVVLALLGVGTLLRHRPANPGSTPPPTTAAKSEPAAQGVQKPSPAQTDIAPSANKPGGDADVLREIPPKISPSAQRTIRGKIKLRVRVHVDSAGNVKRADLVSAGPSKYFARLVVDAARDWKFIPSPANERRWMLHFDLTRRGNTMSAQPIS